MKTKTRILLFVVLLLLAGGGAWIYLRVTVPHFDVVHAARGPAVQAVYATGTVEPTVMMPIAARSAAKLVELNADEGANVTKGQQLARLEDIDLRNNIAALEAQASFARAEYERKQHLISANAVSKSVLDEAKSSMDAAQAAVAKAKAEADYMRLTAPADGLIIRRDGEVGQMIAANQAVFWLSCCAPLRISADVDEEDIAQVQPGQEVLIRADAFPGAVFHGKVQAITPKGDPIARSYRVRIVFTEDTPLKIGMTAETNIVIGKRDNAILLPNGAVQKNAVVWLVKGGRLARKAVKTGARGLEETEILEGVTVEDAVVEKPADKMEEGREVRTSLVPWKP